jgi:hypothetical protein
MRNDRRKKHDAIVASLLFGLAVVVMVSFGISALRESDRRQTAERIPPARNAVATSLRPATTPAAPSGTTGASSP